jgi:hypothetical protein
MTFPSLSDFLQNGRAALAKDPIAIILMEDDIEVDSTLRHHLVSGFRQVIAIGKSDIVVAPDLAAQITRVNYDASTKKALIDAVNGVIEAAPAQSIFYGYNTEYLFSPSARRASLVKCLPFRWKSGATVC